MHSEKDEEDEEDEKDEEDEEDEDSLQTEGIDDGDRGTSPIRRQPRRTCLSKHALQRTGCTVQDMTDCYVAVDE